ncbi:molecular chaperone GrpE [Tenacibaculum sp. MAR_2009_124]|uniref:nucleotide exchange factor GrpE n=1 Tax=Tenacibaculum sp. MAR_2009_124 TaxID=1250059 RepID=UPI00089C933A|nr:nucleotide exchange factor GrpE [Tenacibaculum sp. MAR_2009_124]SEB48395.1 molecular chaperone GrpE [Tenacibaculum sp. MAR_2009_124]
MSKDQYTKEDEIKDALENAELEQKESEGVDIQDEDTVEVEEKVKKEPTNEELLQAEKDKYLRLFAEFENYKKRTSKERIELFKTASQELMTALLPIMDDLDRGLAEIKKSEDSELLKGIELINNKFKNTLTQKGLSEIEVKAGGDFDSEIHEAITQIPAPTNDLKGKIIDCVEKGYKLGDKIIRHPKVVIGQA